MPATLRRPSPDEAGARHDRVIRAVEKPRSRRHKADAAVAAIGGKDEQVIKLQAQLADLQARYDATLRGHTAPTVRLLLPELHDEATGRVDAQKVADLMGCPLKSLATALGLNYKAVHRNPSAAGFQKALRPVKRILELLREFFGPPSAVRAWLNTPHPHLDGFTSLETILKGEAEAVHTLLENAWNGVPG